MERRSGSWGAAAVAAIVVFKAIPGISFFGREQLISLCVCVYIVFICCHYTFANPYTLALGKISLETYMVQLIAFNFFAGLKYTVFIYPFGILAASVLAATALHFGFMYVTGAPGELVKAYKRRKNKAA